MVHEGGMEWRDGTGSPFLFVIGMVTEFIVLGIPAALLSGMTLILRAKQKPNKSPEPTPTSGTVAAEPLGVPAAVVAHLYRSAEADRGMTADPGASLQVTPTFPDE